MHNNDGASAMSRYEELKKDRQHFIDRARECSELTIPSLLPPEGFNQSSELYTPFQSVGARGVNNLASKMLLLLLPPNAPFFRLNVYGDTKKDVDASEAKSDIEKSLAEIEREVAQNIETLSLRVPTFEAIKNLIVTGNTLIHLPKKGNMRVFPLSQFVIRRDASGNLVELVIKETIHPNTLDPEIIGMINAKAGEAVKDELDVYTHSYLLPDGKYYVCQEVQGIKLPDSIGIYKAEDYPFIALRMVRQDNHDYGRSYVEEFLGDLKSLEGLSQSLVESAAASSKLVFMVRPNSTTKKRDLAQTRNGDIITGTRDDVSVLQSEKQYDLAVVEKAIQRFEERLSYAFLLHTAVQRQAERVTAEEIRYMAQQLETALGGVYSLLSQEFQLPLVRLLMKRMTSSGDIPKLPKDIKPAITTGVEALGRGNDLTKLNQFMQQVAQLAQVAPEVMQNINPNDLIKRVATSLGIDTEGLVKSEEQLAQEQEAMQQQMEQQQMMQMAQSAAPSVASNLTKPE